MQSLLEKLTEKWGDHTDADKKTILDDLFTKYSAVDYYVLFGVPLNMSQANIQTVKTSFKKLARILHPDKSKDKVFQQPAQELFKLINNAQDTLTDSSKEKTYRLKINTQNQEKKKSEAEAEAKFTTSFPTRSIYQVFNNNYVYTPNYNSVNTFSTTFSSSSSLPKIYNSDIQASETISSLNNDIIINGNVYGNVKNTSGNITITGNVFGSVQNISGNNIINGNVEKSGRVISTSGDNIIDGDAFGTVSTTSGKNKIKGKIVENTIQKNPVSSGSAFFYSTGERVIVGQNINIVYGRVFNW